jgi:hypothetical protein
MTAHDTLDYEAYLLPVVRHYLLQAPNQRSSEDKDLREVSGCLARLLSHRLKDSDEWDPYKWMDAISPCTAETVSPTHLELTGLVIWGLRGTTKEWIDPFSASIQITDSSTRPLRYNLLFGNADQGLGKCLYNSPQDFPQIPVTDWMFAFSSNL